jgi:hypothetical protein
VAAATKEEWSAGAPALFITFDPPGDAVGVGVGLYKLNPVDPQLESAALVSTLEPIK